MTECNHDWKINSVSHTRICLSCGKIQHLEYIPTNDDRFIPIWKDGNYNGEWDLKKVKIFVDGKKVYEVEE